MELHVALIFCCELSRWSLVFPVDFQAWLLHPFYSSWHFIWPFFLSFLGGGYFSCSSMTQNSNEHLKWRYYRNVVLESAQEDSLHVTSFYLKIFYCCTHKSEEIRHIDNCHLTFSGVNFIVIFSVLLAFISFQQYSFSLWSSQILAVSVTSIFSHTCNLHWHQSMIVQ